MTADEVISIARLAKQVDEMAENMVTKDLLESEINRIDQAIASHREYSKSSSEAETSRINEILKTNADALRQANNEANESKASAARQTEDVAKTLREVVETTRSAASKSQSEVINPIINRFNEIEQKQYENKGKEAVSDPMMTKFMEKLEAVASAISSNQGASKGMSALWGWIVSGIMLALAVASRFIP